MSRASILTFRTVFVRALPAVALSWASTAAAQGETGLAACGNIDISARAECEVVTGGGCELQCEPVNFEAACTGECSGSCEASFTAECVGACEADCDAECSVQGGEFDCEASCSGVCEADCEGACEGTEDGAACRGRCEARCEGSCQADCSAEPPQADCSGRCEASCEGRCEVQANAECDATCHGSCVANLEGGCVARCSQPEGALFCDGQYVDTGNNLEECAAAIEAVLDIDVEGYASGSASCEGNTCVAEGEAGCSCGVPRSDSRSTGTAALLLGALSGVVVARRRRSR